MLRSVTLGVALSVLAAACGLVEQPPPPGTRMIQTRIFNQLPRQAEVAVVTPSGVLPGAVQPSSVPAKSATDVSLHVPSGAGWWITVDGVNTFAGAELEEFFRQQGCPFGLVLADEGPGAGCLGDQEYEELF